jgi:hypothetical protein
LEDLAKIHPEARDTVEFGVFKDWALDWFANDACDRRHRRWVEGALKAAIKKRVRHPHRHAKRNALEGLITSPPIAAGVRVSAEYSVTLCEPGVFMDEPVNSVASGDREQR